MKKVTSLRSIKINESAGTQAVKLKTPVAHDDAEKYKVIKLLLDDGIHAGWSGIGDNATIIVGSENLEKATKILNDAGYPVI